MYTAGIQGVYRHDKLRSKFALAARHGFKKYYVTHQLAQCDIGITNTGIYNFLDTIILKTKDLQCPKFKKDITLHFIMAKPIDLEAMYGNSVLDLDYGTTHIHPAIC
jgi:hypothetical protein